MRQRTWFEMPTFVRHNYNGLARQTDGRWFGLHRSEPWASRRQANEVAGRLVESGHTNVRVTHDDRTLSCQELAVAACAQLDDLFTAQPGDTFELHLPRA